MSAEGIVRRSRSCEVEERGHTGLTSRPDPLLNRTHMDSGGNQSEDLEKKSAGAGGDYDSASRSH
jgi:hypothetical protein